MDPRGCNGADVLGFFLNFLLGLRSYFLGITRHLADISSPDVAASWPRSSVSQLKIQWEVNLLRSNVSDEDEASVGRRVLTSSGNVGADDGEVEANEKMMKNANLWRSFLSGRWRSSWHFSHYCRDGFSPHRSGVRACCHVHAPPARPLVTKAPIAASLIEGEQKPPMPYGSTSGRRGAPPASDSSLH